MRQHKHDLSRPPRAYRRPSWQPEWTELAKCNHPSVDPEMFFPFTGGGGRTDKRLAQEFQRAKDFCQSCPVIDRCRETFADEPAGVFGGMTPDERKQWAQEAAA